VQWIAEKSAAYGIDGINGIYGIRSESCPVRVILKGNLWDYEHTCNGQAIRCAVEPAGDSLSPDPQW
jgi:hypothetical protein